MSTPLSAPGGPSELSTRVLSAIVMAAVAVGVTYAGGWVFKAFWLLAAIAVAVEWRAVAFGASSLVVWQEAVLGFALGMAMAAIVDPLTAPALYSFKAPVWWALVAAALVAAPLFAAWARGALAQWINISAGQLYGGALGVSVVLCRGSEFSGTALNGMIVIFWLFAIVWGTDTVAYFSGRTLGGPKLWPRVSPKKTWSGAMGGLLGGVVLAYGVLHGFGVTPLWQHVALSAALSIASQSGDLFESAFKRRYGAKDSSQLIPGHGGLMDRLDGFIFAVALAAAIGIWRSGLTGVPNGLMMWP